MIKTNLFSKFGLSTLFTIAFLSYSCVAPNYALKGKYPDAPFQTSTNKSYEEVWSNIIDLFSSKGIAIKIIDRLSGLITSETTSFRNSYTREDQTGNIIDKSAFVVIGDIRGGFNNKLEPQVITGDWNIRVKEVEGQTVIYVNLVNLKCQYTNPSTQYGPGSIVDLPIKSTGVFEKSVAEFIK